MSKNLRFCFIGEYFDMMASLVRQYQIFFYPEDQSIEIFDIKNKKLFLRRIINPDVTQKDIFLGADVNIYSRKIKIVAYGDSFTEKTFEEIRSSTFALILPGAYMSIGKIIDIVNASGFSISKLKMNKLGQAEAEEFLKIHGECEVSAMEICSDLVVGLELVKKKAIEDLKQCIAGVIAQNVKSENNKPLMICSNDSDKAKMEIEFFFGMKHSPQLTNCSCLVLKPHIINEGNAGKIIDIVLNEGFEVSSMEMFYLDKQTAEGFFDVYKGVLPEYAPIVQHVISGPVIALEVRQDDVVNKLRALIGPHDPELAKTLRPNTIRAVFGKDRVRNVCHCTDLPEDGVLECQYFFELL